MMKKSISILLSVMLMLIISSCKANVERIYLCPSCFTEYDNLQDAINCCKIPQNENPEDDTNSKNIIINGRNFGKTEFVTVIPKGKKAVIPNANCIAEDKLSDVFNPRRNITLSAFTMCKYEVTQELYEFVMGSVPISDKENRYGTERQKYRPAQGINWYEAVIFCNKLSELTDCESVYSISNISYANLIVFFSLTHSSKYRLINVW